MFAEYIQAGLRHAKYEILEEGTYMSTVEGLQGVIAIGDTIEECRQDLIEVIEGWIALRLRMGDTIPSIDGVINRVQIWDHGKVKRGSDGGSQRNLGGDLRRAWKHMRRAVGAKFRFEYDRNHDNNRYACKNAA